MRILINGLTLVIHFEADDFFYCIEGKWNDSLVKEIV